MQSIWWKLLSHVQPFVTPWTVVTLWTVACQAYLSMEFSRQEYWCGLPFPPTGYLPNLGIKPSRFFTIWTTREAPTLHILPGCCQPHEIHARSSGLVETGIWSWVQILAPLRLLLAVRTFDCWSYLSEPQYPLLQDTENDSHKDILRNTWIKIWNVPLRCSTLYKCESSIKFSCYRKKVLLRRCSVLVAASWGSLGQDKATTWAPRWIMKSVYPQKLTIW